MGLQLKVFVNSDSVNLVWQTSARINGCRGFAINRKLNGIQDVLPTWVGFTNEKSDPGTTKPSTQWPVQKFMWNDFQVRPGDEVSYQVTSMIGNAGSLRGGEASDWTPLQKVQASGADGMYSYFNRGVLGCQWISRNVQGDITKSIIQAIATPGDKVRDFLSGQLRIQLLQLLAEAKKAGGEVYAALFELNDPELLQALLNLSTSANVILANGATKKEGEDENREAREKLNEGRVHVYDRMLTSSRLGHNKFMVLCDKGHQPYAVWTGSTNWTETGLCTQANNGIIIRDAGVGAVYKSQWDHIKQAGDGFPPALVNSNDSENNVVTGQSKTVIWFTPTKGMVDLESASAYINAAQRGILFLMFNPGPSNLSLLSDILQKKSKDPNIFLHGVINQDPSTTKNPVQLYHRGEKQTAGFDIILPAAINQGFAYWRKELLKLPTAHAIVHSKVIVLDPFSANPVVMTGSHNLGPKASSSNDENLLIIENNPRLAGEYAVNIMSVYSHYRFAFYRSKKATVQNWNGLEDDDKWQDGYLKGEKLDELNFWLGK